MCALKNRGKKLTWRYQKPLLFDMKRDKGTILFFGRQAIF